MAEALQVTNSTYHNWRRGTTVPHVNQQKEILQRIEALESNVAAGKDAPRGKPMRRSSSKGAKARKGTASSGTRNGSSRNRLEDYGLDGGSNGADPSYRMDTVPPGTPSASAKVPRDDIAAITVAFIQSQKNVSAGSVFEFVKGLREVM